MSSSHPSATDDGSTPRAFTRRTTAATVAALVAFAANSVLCRLALGGAAIDAASFTTIRLVTGALTLLVLARTLHRGQPIQPCGSWLAATALFGYAIAFSFAYLSLSAGTGALLLFGAVQLTMILRALRAGERPRALEWVGLGCALGGLVYLVLPGVTAPAPLGAASMAFAGVCWGVYSLLGRGSVHPLLDTAANFIRAAPFAVVVSVLAFAFMHVSVHGMLLATASGALASALGYVVWYTALAGLTATRAATVQLTVPLLAALGGVIFLDETPTLRLSVAAVLILGGIALAIAGRSSGSRGR